MNKLHFLLILLILFLIKGLEAHKPSIIPDTNEIVINAGEQIEITCINNQEIKFFFPKTERRNRIMTSSLEIVLSETNNSSFKQWTFRRRKSVYGDSGWYGCADLTLEITSKDHNHPNASWLFVYVKSNISAFVENEQFNGKEIFAHSETVILPCRLTSPNLNVVLYYHKNGTKIKWDQIISFDPKVGFLINISSISDTGFFTCRAENNGFSFDISYLVQISYNYIIPEIKIQKKQEHVASGMDIIVNCTIEIEEFENPSCLWAIPREHIDMHDNYEMYLTEKEVGSNLKKHICSVRVSQVTLSDMGLYTCWIWLSEAIISTETYIHVYGNSSISINRTDLSENEAIEGDNVILQCSAPRNCANLTWVNKYRQSLNIPDKYSISYGESSQTDAGFNLITLKIYNLQKSDGTVFICKAENENNPSCTLAYYDFIIHTPQAPTFKEVNLNNTEIIVTNVSYPILKCFVKGFPEPVISWYKNNIELEDNELDFTILLNIKYSDMKEIITKKYMFGFDKQWLAINTLPQSVSENYSCTAKNRYGQIQAYQVFTIEEYNNDFIIGTSITTLLLILVATFFIYIFIQIQQRKKRREYLEAAGLLHFKEGAGGRINPNLMIHDQIESLSYDKKWEFTKGRLKLGEKLGNGAFGIVVKAQAYGIRRGEEVTPVAVKMAHLSSEAYQVRALARELKVMIYLGQHLNVVNLLGAYTNNITKGELLVIVEYCHFGNLHDYLLHNRKHFINQIDLNNEDTQNRVQEKLSNTEIMSSNNTGVLYETTFIDSKVINFENDQLPSNEAEHHHGDIDSKPIYTKDLISWAFQVSRGMEYLSQKRILHGDLAARNVLLTNNNVVKICDFGLSKLLYKEYNCTKKSSEPVPIKWMAIESIRDEIFSIESDVWSYGILLWEFFTLAELPYPGIPDEQLLRKLLEGHRMERPKYATMTMYNMMLDCWKENPCFRPLFASLTEKMSNLLEDNVKSYYLELSASYEEINAKDLKNKNGSYWAETAKCV